MTNLKSVPQTVKLKDVVVTAAQDLSTAFNLKDVDKIATHFEGMLQTHTIFINEQLSKCMSLESLNATLPTIQLMPDQFIEKVLDYIDSTLNEPLYVKHTTAFHYMSLVSESLVNFMHNRILEERDRISYSGIQTGAGKIIT